MSNEITSSRPNCWAYFLSSIDPTFKEPYFSPPPKDNLPAGLVLAPDPQTATAVAFREADQTMLFHVGKLTSNNPQQIDHSSPYNPTPGEELLDDVITQFSKNPDLAPIMLEYLTLPQ